MPLTFDGKANRLSSMVKANLPAAMQGLAAIPLLVGYDIDHDDPNERGRIFSFDVAGDRHEEFGGYTAIGSGSVFAKSSLKKLYRSDLDARGCATAVVQALYDAADDDSATGGPDITRRIFPVVHVITPDGGRRMPDDEACDRRPSDFRMPDRRLSARDGPSARPCRMTRSSSAAVFDGKRIGAVTVKITARPSATSAHSAACSRAINLSATLSKRKRGAAESPRPVTTGPIVATRTATRRPSMLRQVSGESVARSVEVAEKCVATRSITARSAGLDPDMRFLPPGVR